MDDLFPFQAPVYVDFKNKDAFNTTDDEFFNYYREDGEIPENSSGSFSNDSCTDNEPTRNQFRRSSSVNDINKLQNENVNQISESLNHLNLNGGTGSSINQPQKSISIENMQSEKYLTLAEQIRKFHSKTPDRFKSKPKPFQMAKYQPVYSTIPQSPQLTTKMRSRPTHILTTEEKELLELEEIQRSQFKAHEVNKNIFKAPKTIVPVEKKPNTNFEPFNLTEVKKKAAPPLEEFKFHANPVQKKMFESTIGIPEKQQIKPTVPKTPSFMKASGLRSKHLAINSKSGQLEYQDDAHHGIHLHKSPKPTQVKPFNVIKRGEASQRRKEEKIKQILEEEKKMREFHAKPAPKFVRPKNPNSNSDVTSISATSSQESNEENQTVILNTFKARPATVLLKKPFVPVKKARPLTEVKQFELTLDQRIKKREEFEHKLKEKEDMKKKLLEKNEEIKRQQEEAELNRLRQEAIIKAQPIKKFKEFLLKPSLITLTSPHTPKFSSRIKK